LIVFTARHRASVVYAVVVCLSVCLSVCLTQVGVLLKRLMVGSRKQLQTIAGDSRCLMPKISAKLKLGHASQTEAPNAGACGRLKLVTFDK